MKTILIDDEIKSIDLLEFHLTEYFDHYNIIGRYNDITTALVNILKLRPDIIFLDINMPNGSGLELLGSIKELGILTIFVSAHSKHAIEAIKLNCFDYLLKPININELNRVDRKLNNHFSNVIKEGKLTKIRIKISANHYVFHVDEIVSVSSEGNYCTILSTNQKPIIISKNLKKVEFDYFLSSPFFRCHQSHIININHIKEYSSYEIKLSNGKRIPISSKKMDDLLGLIS